MSKTIKISQQERDGILTQEADRGGAGAAAGETSK